MTQSFLERIHKAGSSRSIRSRSIGPSSSHGAGDESSVTTFEFDNMDVVKDAQPRRRRRRDGRPASIREALSCADRRPDIWCDGHEECDHDGEPLLRTTQSSGVHCLDESNRESFQIGSASETSGFSKILPNRTVMLCCVIAAVGLVASTLFLGFGISNAVHNQGSLFAMRATSLSLEIKQTWDAYTTTALWIYEACTVQPISRENFSTIYHYARSHLDIEAIHWIPKVSDEDREALEAESFEYFQENHLGEVNYRGIMEVVLDDLDEVTYLSTSNLQPRSRHPTYYPFHLIEPFNDWNFRMIELDALGSELHRDPLQYTLATYLPAATATYRRMTAKNESSVDRYIEILHPGIPLPDKPGMEPRDLVGLVIRFKALMEAASQGLPESLSVFIYDSTASGVEPEFLVAVELYKEPIEDTGERIVYLDEMSMSELLDVTVFHMHINEIQIASRTWTLVAVALDDTYEPELTSVMLAGKFLMITSIGTALWIWTNYRRTRTILEIKRVADHDKTQVIVRSAREKAKSEQELNDYIAHEIRNPLAAAMSACTFVKSAINDESLNNTRENLKAIREDVEIIDSSLTYTHDLLRSMLDMHRAASHDLTIHETPLDVTRDILEPVASMLYQRNVGFELLTECPEGLFVLSDRLRIKQMLLNLCRNSARYVQKGYIKVGAQVVDGNVQFFVEDSGLGISLAGRNNLFSRFQESLEVMDQGSGVGLCLCKSMALLLHGDIWLDENFDSGIIGFPGTRFVIGLNKGPLSENEVKRLLDTIVDASAGFPLSTLGEANSMATSCDSSMDPNVLMPEPNPMKSANGNNFTMLPDESFHIALNSPLDINDEEGNMELPSAASVLFVDDDMILRKLFMRSVRKVMNSWDIHEAASGEAALKMTDSKEFDIIFMDQYMASVEKKLLGTETVHAMRSKGVLSRICGLSANDVEEGFLSSGADMFMFKPFPCKKDELERELCRVWSSRRQEILSNVDVSSHGSNGGASPVEDLNVR